MTIPARIIAIRGLFIHDLTSTWKLLSVWAFMVIGAMPDIYNGIASMGWADEVPDKFKWILRGMAASGVALRVINQRI